VTHFEHIIMFIPVLCLLGLKKSAIKVLFTFTQ